MTKPIRLSPLRQDITFAMGYLQIPLTVTIDNVCLTFYQNRRIVTELYFQDDIETLLFQALRAL